MRHRPFIALLLASLALAGVAYGALTGLETFRWEVTARAVEQGGFAGLPGVSFETVRFASTGGTGTVAPRQPFGTGFSITISASDPVLALGETAFSTIRDIAIKSVTSDNPSVDVRVFEPSIAVSEEREWREQLFGQYHHGGANLDGVLEISAHPDGQAYGLSRMWFEARSDEPERTLLIVQALTPGGNVPLGPASPDWDWQRFDRSLGFAVSGFRFVPLIRTGPEGHCVPTPDWDCSRPNTALCVDTPEGPCPVRLGEARWYHEIERVRSQTISGVVVASLLDQPPVANPDGPYTGTVGVELEFDASGSYDPDGDPIERYCWDFKSAGSFTCYSGAKVKYFYDGVWQGKARPGGRPVDGFRQLLRPPRR